LNLYSKTSFVFEKLYTHTHTHTHPKGERRERERETRIRIHAQFFHVISFLHFHIFYFILEDKKEEEEKSKTTFSEQFFLCVPQNANSGHVCLSFLGILASPLTFDCSFFISLFSLLIVEPAFLYTVKMQNIKTYSMFLLEQFFNQFYTFDA
jgi:hypothetical protein